MSFGAFISVGAERRGAGPGQRPGSAAGLSYSPAGPFEYDSAGILYTAGCGSRMKDG